MTAHWGPRRATVWVPTFRQLQETHPARASVARRAALATARRLGLAPAAEALAAGVLIVLMNAPFDMTGPAAGWWRWFDNDPNIAYRWFGVPVTSYYWHFAFGAILAGLTARAARDREPLLAIAAPLLAGATIALGMLSFAPFHLLKAIGIGDGSIVGVALATGSGIALAALRRCRRPGPTPVVVS